MTYPGFNFKDPNYSEVFAIRVERLQRIRADKSGALLRDLKAFYATDEGLPHFINDWGCTFDPRLAERNLPTIVPFVLFPKQFEWCSWMLERWRTPEPGLTEKSRDCGITWLAISAATTLCLFREGMQIGFGSRKEEYVDSTKSPKAIFWKGRQFLELLPAEFRGGWQRSDATHMRIAFPSTNSVITGEAGDNIGRGDRAGIYFTDEDAFLERPQLVEASLSATTNCRISISTPNGMANPFAEKRHSKRFNASGKRIFVFDWRDDPRKDDAWYAKQENDLLPHVLAQEVDRNYSASVVGVVIPQAWVQACVDLHEKLGFDPRGERWGTYDPADEGDDCAFCDATGVLVNSVMGWSGRGSDTLASTQKVFAFCDVLGIGRFEYDADGLGAGVKGDARSINEKRKNKLDVQGWRGSGEVVDKEKQIETAAPRNEKKDPNEIVRLNGDYYMNAKAQGWFSLRARFQRGYRALQMHLKGEDWREAYHADDLISLNGNMPELSTLTSQLSQPTYTQSTAGKMVIDKMPDGARSPNHADTVMIRFAPRKRRGRYKLDAWKA